MRSDNPEHESCGGQKTSSTGGPAGRLSLSRSSARHTIAAREGATDPVAPTATGEIALDAGTVELLAERIAEKLEARTASKSGWVTADVVAAYLRVNVQWVYDHGYELGGVRLGDETTQGRWRFRLDRVDELLQSTACSPEGEPRARHGRTVERNTPRGRLGLTRTGVDLLPVKGDTRSPSKRK